MPAKEPASKKRYEKEKTAISNELLELSKQVSSEAVEPFEKLRNELVTLSREVTDISIGEGLTVRIEPLKKGLRVLHLQSDELRTASLEMYEKLHRLSEALHNKLAKSLPNRGVSASSTKWVDPDDAPEWTEEDFDRADLYRGDKLIRRGRPPSDHPKQALKLRIDADVVEHFRATGPGWQTRINDTLRRAAKLKARA